jgi:HAD superfamily hydrolase (TIGR01450 family)
VPEPAAPAGSERPLSDVHDLVLLDLDGVIYLGPDPVPHAAEAVGRVREAGVRTTFVTNNASRPPEVVAGHLTQLGIRTGRDEVVTSAQAAAALLAGRFAPGSKVLVVGGEGLYAALRERDLVPVAALAEEPVAVVQGFSPDLGWRMLAEGTRAVRSGLPWIATNTDLTVPTPFGPAPGNGTLVAAVRTASGIEPEVAGKPASPLLDEAVKRYGSDRPLMVGDRLDTDLAGAVTAGMPGLLVLTGVNGATDAVAAAPAERPRYVAGDLRGLLQPHPQVEVRDVRATCRAATVTVRDGRLAVEAAGEDPVDLLRAACGAAWTWADTRPDGDAVDPAELLQALRGLEADLAWAR